MTQMAEDLKGKLAALPSQDRAELAYFLLHSLDDGQDVDWEEAWAKELNQRAQDVRSGAVTLEPADKVFAELRKKYS